MSPIEVRYESVNHHPPGGREEIIVRAGDVRLAEVAARLRDAGFPRPPSTFSLGRQYLIPGETTGTLTVRSKRGKAEVSCFAGAWDEDPGYARVFEALRPPRAWPAEGRFTFPEAADLKLGCRYGSAHASGHHWLSILPAGKASLFVERGLSRLSADGALSDDELAAVVSAARAIRWRDERPPFDASPAMNGHTPAAIFVNAGRPDEAGAYHALAWEQRRAAPRWAALVDALEPLLQRLLGELA